MRFFQTVARAASRAELFTTSLSSFSSATPCQGKYTHAPRHNQKKAQRLGSTHYPPAVPGACFPAPSSHEMINNSKETIDTGNSMVIAMRVSSALAPDHTNNNNNNYNNHNNNSDISSKAPVLTPAASSSAIIIINNNIQAFSNPLSGSIDNSSNRLPSLSDPDAETMTMLTDAMSASHSAAIAGGCTYDGTNATGADGNSLQAAPSKNPAFSLSITTAPSLVILSRTTFCVKGIAMDKIL
jgi:hypothetical protein